MIEEGRRSEDGLTDSEDLADGSNDDAVNAYEQERAERIAANKREMNRLGLGAALEQVTNHVTPVACTTARSTWHRAPIWSSGLRPSHIT